MILIAKKHNDWIKTVIYFGCDKETAEDIVQEMYIKLIKSIKSNGLDIMYNKNEINYYYIYKTLKSLFIDLKRKEKNITIYSIDEVRSENNEKRINIQSYTTDINYDEAYEKIQNELSRMYWYNRKVFEIINGQESIAELSRISKIPYYSLYNTYNKVKSKLKKLLIILIIIILL